MADTPYYSALGGHSGQEQLLSGRAVFTEAYAFIPKGVMQDIVTSNLPFWEDTRCWVIARPMSGFAETFSQYILEVSPGGGSANPETDMQAQAVLFVVSGAIDISINDTQRMVGEGGFVFIPAGSTWALKNTSTAPAVFHWIRKAYQPVAGIEPPPVCFAQEQEIEPSVMPDTNGVWSTKRFLDPTDLRFDMNVNIVSFEPGGVIPFMETHVMEHGLYVLEGKAVYRLNRDWVEVEAGDFMWLRAFCPQACYAGGPGRFRYLLYKDVNRHMPLSVGARP